MCIRDRDVGQSAYLFLHTHVLFANSLVVNAHSGLVGVCLLYTSDDRAYNTGNNAFDHIFVPLK